MISDIFPVHDRGIELTSLKNFLAWHKQMCAESVDWRLDYGDVEAHVDETAGKATVYANFLLGGLGMVKVSHLNVLEYARYGPKENGVWKLLAMSSLRGQSLNDGR